MYHCRSVPNIRALGFNVVLRDVAGILLVTRQRLQSLSALFGTYVRDKQDQVAALKRKLESAPEPAASIARPEHCDLKMARCASV